MQQKEVEKKREWVRPELTLYGDMTALTQQCLPPTCKAKTTGLGDDFSQNISTFTG